MTGTFKTMRQAARRLRQSPGFTAVSVLTLAVAVGANAAIFSLVKGVLLESLPFPEPDRLVSLWHSAPGMGIDRFEQSEGSYLVYRERAESLDGVGLYLPRDVTIMRDGVPARSAAVRATGSFFETLAVPALRGRTLQEEDTRPGSPNVVVLSHGLWTTGFGQDADVIGRLIEVDGESWEIVGVMPAHFALPGIPSDLWLPFRIDPVDPDVLSFSYRSVARLGSGATVESASAEVGRLLWLLPDLYPDLFPARILEQGGWRALAQPLRQDAVGEVAGVIWILFAGMGFVLLIALANVANLVLLRAGGRQRDVAVQTAMGASRRDISWQFFGETLGISALGGVIGVMLAHAALGALVAAGPPELRLLATPGLEPVAALYAGALALFTGTLLGFVALRRHGRPNLVGALKEGGRGSVTRSSHRARRVLVVAQISLAVVLLVGSGLMLRTFQAMRSVDPGFSTEGVLTFRISLQRGNYPDGASATQFFTRAIDNLESLPGVARVGASSSRPLVDIPSIVATHIDGYLLSPDDMPPAIRSNTTREGFFEAMGIPILQGRSLERRDAEEWTAAAVVTEAFAQRFWPGQEPLGNRLTRMDEGATYSQTELYTVVGVAGNVRDESLTSEAPPIVYYSAGVSEFAPPGEDLWDLALSIRTTGSAEALLEPARRAIWTLDPTLPIIAPRTTGQIVNEGMAMTSFALLLLGMAAAVALLLGTVGLYGVISYAVSYRTREIGVRMAVGAAQRQVSSMVVRDGLAMGVVGVLLGLVAAGLLTRFMQSLLFEVSTTDLPTFLSVPVLLLAVAILASWLPARRASRVHPAEALRSE